MKLGNFSFYLLIFLFSLISYISADEKIETIPLINLDELSPTFEEDKDELEKNEDKNSVLVPEEDLLQETVVKKNNKVFINLKALDKITAKTSAFKIAVGEKKFFGPLEIKALKCEFSKNKDPLDTVAYLQVKDLSIKDNNQVFLFNGWTFASSPTLQSIDHPVYDLWITSCENI